MHEQSKTIKRNGKWINVYGRALPNAGQQLPGTSTYDTLEEAELAAVKRSNSYGVKKYEGLKSLEASHIKLNRTKALINAIKQKIAVKSGQADIGIQVPGFKEKPTPGIGKYWSRPVTSEETMFENLKPVFDNYLKDQTLQSSDFNFETHRDMLLNTGPFADAKRRQATFQVAGNKYGEAMLKELESDKVQAPMQTTPVPGITSQAPYIAPNIDAFEAERKQRAAAMEAQDKKQAQTLLDAEKKKNRKLLGLE